jgi:hypothetical protein
MIAHWAFKLLYNQKRAADPKLVFAIVGPFADYALWSNEKALRN